MLQKRQKVLAKAPSTRDPHATWVGMLDGRYNPQIWSKHLRTAFPNLPSDVRGKVLLAINDVTELEATRYELEGHKEYSEKIIDSLREALLVLDRDLRVKHANQPFYAIFKVKPEETEGRLVYELGNNQWDIPELRRLLEGILPERESFDDFEVRHDFETIGPKVMLINARRLDHLNLILLAIEDITERKRAEEQQQTLSRELAHRVKNVITLVDSMARQTLSRSQSLADFADAFHGRLRSVARAQGQLLLGQWRNVDIRALATATLDGCGGDPSQVEMQGEPVSLLSHQAMAVSLTLHELCTNAIKYGALSSQAGRVALTWSVKVIEGVRHVRLEWRETGGPGVEPPSRKGFGTQLIESLCPHELHGEVRLDFDQAGLSCELLFPLR
jgi:two-component system CheB/CheR fusion protein